MDRYELRRAILTAFCEFQNPTEIVTIFYNQGVCRALGKLILRGDDTLPVRRETENLRDQGYLVEIAGYEGWYRVADDVRLQLDAADGKLERSALKRDPYLFGPAVMR